MDKTNKVFIYGVPGVGKTHFSRFLGERLQLPVIEGDQIKDKVQSREPRSLSPFLYLGTCQAYREFGHLNEENVLKGLFAVRDTFQEGVIQEYFVHEAEQLGITVIDNTETIDKFSLV